MTTDAPKGALAVYKKAVALSGNSFLHFWPEKKY
jgi:hypothetical protein